MDRPIWPSEAHHELRIQYATSIQTLQIAFSNTIFFRQEYMYHEKKHAMSRIFYFSLILVGSCTD